MSDGIEQIDGNGLIRKLGYDFRNPELLLEALCHASYVNEQGDTGFPDNERLEFLGDAVLDLAVSHVLMERYPAAEEGVLSKYRALVVDEAALYEVALKLQLGTHLLLGRGEEQSGGREKPSILADAVEALIGAVYLDGGFQRAMGVIVQLFDPLLAKVGADEIVHDYKSLLQEYTQQVHQILPRYRLIQESGPSHNKRFTVALTLRDRIVAEGEGRSKKEAEQKAAREAFYCLREDLHH